jgi:hypothetical protein
MPSENDDPVDLGRAVCVEERKLAVRVVLAGVHYWLPKSILHDDSEVYKMGDSGKLIVKQWWAEKEGWV